MKYFALGLFVAAWLAAAYGWIANIVKLFHAINDPVTGMTILRGAGVFLAPLGAVLGFL